MSIISCLLALILTFTVLSFKLVGSRAEGEHAAEWELAIAVSVETPTVFTWIVEESGDHDHEHEEGHEGGEEAHLRAVLHLVSGSCFENSIHNVEDAAHEFFEDNATDFTEVEFGEMVAVSSKSNHTVGPVELHPNPNSFISIYFINVTEAGCLVMFLEHSLSDFLRLSDGSYVEPSFTEPVDTISLGNYSVEVWVTALGATLLTSLISLVGALVFIVLLFPGKGWITEYSPEALALSAGVLLAVGFLHLLPEGNELYGDLDVTFGMVVLASMLVALALKLMLDHLGPVDAVTTKRNVLDAEGGQERAQLLQHSSALNVVWGDAFHNFTDGILIATAFGVCASDPSLGWFVTSSVVFHELPQEIADFAIIYNDLGSICAALLFNLISSLSAILGAVIVLAIGQIDDTAQGLLFAVNIGILAFISLGEVVPRLADGSSGKRKALRLLLVVFGFIIIGLLQLNVHGHCEAGHHDEDHDHAHS